MIRQQAHVRLTSSIYCFPFREIPFFYDNFTLINLMFLSKYTLSLTKEEKSNLVLYDL